MFQFVETNRHRRPTGERDFHANSSLLEGERLFSKVLIPRCYTCLSGWSAISRLRPSNRTQVYTTGGTVLPNWKFRTDFRSCHFDLIANRFGTKLPAAGSIFPQTPQIVLSLSCLFSVQSNQLLRPITEE